MVERTFRDAADAWWSASENIGEDDNVVKRAGPPAGERRQSQGEDPTAVEERVFLGRGLAPDTAPPVVGPVLAVREADAIRITTARIHDRKSPSLATEATVCAADAADNEACRDLQVFEEAPPVLTRTP